MPISFADAIGNLFNRLGKVGLLVEQMRSYQNSQLTNMTDTSSGVVAQFNGESDIQAIMGSSYIGQLNLVGAVGSLAQSLASSTINRMVYRDNPRLGQTLESNNTVEAIKEVIRQMKVAGASVLAMTVTATPSSTITGTGTGVIVTSVRRPFDGVVLENSFTETIQITCSDDSYTGSASAGNESFDITGTALQGSPFDFNWPVGSGASSSLNAIGSASNDQGNLLNNSDYEDWTTNKPDNWELVTGTAGTHIAEETSIVYDSTGALRIIGDGSTLVQLRQKFNDTDGTNSNLDPATQYSFNVFMRRGGTAVSSGTMIIDLVDTNGIVIQDENGTNNSLTFDLTTLTTVYTAFNGVFRTPRDLPAVVYIRMRLSVAVPTGQTVYADRGSLGVMSQAYVSGPYVSLHSGSIPFLIGDYGTVAVTNSRGSGGSLDTWQTLMARLLPEMISEEFLLPSSSAPSIADTLIG